MVIHLSSLNQKMLLSNLGNILMSIYVALNYKVSCLFVNSAKIISLFGWGKVKHTDRIRSGNANRDISS